MKQRIFTLLMMLALMVVAGSAMAESIVGDSEKPYKGGQYSYSLDGITTTAGSTITLSYEVGSGATFYASDGTTVQTTYSNGSALTNYTLSFKVTYASNATTGKIKVNIAQTGGCENSITLDIVPQDRPTLTLAATTTADQLCQKVDGTTNNEDATNGATANTIDFTVEPTTTATNFTYDYTLTLSPDNVNGTTYSVSLVSGGGTIDNSDATVVLTGATTTSVIRLTFNSTEGAATAITGTLSAGTLHVSTNEGGGTVSCTNYGTPPSKNIGAVPTIGTFSGLN